MPVYGKDENNLCVQAYHLLKKDFAVLAAVKMHLHKVIPLGAGLGGGSADGAFTLQLLNDKFHLGLSVQQLIGYATELGSDCPFFIINKPCIAGGRGEVLEEINLDLSGWYIALINPGIHINTSFAFSKILPSLPDTSIKEIIHLAPEFWKDKLVNDFEQPVFEDYPEIRQIKENLYQQGAAYAAMSGSGSTVFGIFYSAAAPVLNLPSHYFYTFLPL